LPPSAVTANIISSLFFDLLGAQTLQELLFSLYVYYLLHVPPFLLYAMILFLFLIHFVIDVVAQFQQ
jgi:hypothetical protein